MPLIAAERSAMADFEAPRVAFISLHTADPNVSGASEATGGSPAYARKAAVFAAAAGGTATSGELSFDVPTGTYPFFGAWSALTGGTFRGGNALAASQTFTAQGVLKLTVSIPVTAS